MSDTEEQISNVEEEQISSEEQISREDVESEPDSALPVKPPKKKRVLSEERKAVLREQLAKVRSKRFEMNKPLRDLKTKIQKLKVVTDREKRAASLRALEELDTLSLDEEKPDKPELPIETEYERRFRLARSQIFPSFR